MAVSSAANLRITARYRQALQRARLDSFEALLTTSDGHLMRRLRDRENWRLDLAETDGTVRRAYLKRHRQRSLTTRLRSLLGLGPGRTAGRVEADYIERLDGQGVPTMALMAFGERLRRDGTLESFLLTEELTGFTQLDLFLEDRFRSADARTSQDLRELIGRVAALAGRFHRLGYNHRDFYTCHFFIRESPAGRFAVHLIDLQRVQRWPVFRRRWIVKDLAQLAYSAPAFCIGPTQRMRFLRHYLGVGRLRPCDKRLIRSVLRRERAMRSKLGPYR